MAKEKREKKVILTTPAGIAAYPRLLGKPDTKFKPEGTWSVKVKWPDASEPAVAKMLEQYEAVIAQALALGKQDEKFMAGLKKRKKKFEEADRSILVDEDTGEVTATFKMTATGERKDGTEWSRKPAVFDAAGKPVAPDTKIGSGTKMKVAYTMEPFYTGVGAGASLRLEAVQILELVEWVSGTASQFGFSAEEAAEDAEDNEDEDNADDETEDDDEEGDF